MSLFSFAKVINPNDEMPVGYSLTGQNSLMPTAINLDLSKSFKSKRATLPDSDDDSYDDIQKKRSNNSKLYSTIGVIQASSLLISPTATRKRGCMKGKSETICNTFCLDLTFRSSTGQDVDSKECHRKF